MANLLSIFWPSIQYHTFGGSHPETFDITSTKNDSFCNMTTEQPFERNLPLALGTSSSGDSDSFDRYAMVVPKPPTPPRIRALSKKYPTQRKEPSRNRDSFCPLSPGKQRPPSRPRLVFDSPRLEMDDKYIFPKAKDLEDPSLRWNYQSDLAGDHRQDGSVLKLRACLAPRSLLLGIPAHAAHRVKELHLPLHQGKSGRIKRDSQNCKTLQHQDDEEDEILSGDNQIRLPQWMDVIVHTFHNLQHLYLNANHDSDREPENSTRLRRLYVIYRLPDLLSIDGVQIAETERVLARPLSPNGHRVSPRNWLKQRLAEHQEKTTDQLYNDNGKKKPKRDMQEWLSKVLDEKKEAELDYDPMHKPANIEVDLTGKMTQVALSPQNTFLQPEMIYETTSSVATADCWAAATCGHFFRPDSMRKQWNKSRLRFSSGRGPESHKTAFMDNKFEVKTPKVVTSHQSVQTENGHLTIVEAGNTSPVLSRSSRANKSQPPPRLVLDANKSQPPPRLVLDATKGSPEQISSLIIKAVPPTAPTMPSSGNVRCPANHATRDKAKIQDAVSNKAFNN